MKTRVSALALLLLILAGTLRFSFLDYGFPRLLHPDEPTAIKRVLAFQRGDLNPRWFAMPSGFLYLIHFTEEGLNFLGIDVQEKIGPYLIGRILSALLGSLTILVVFLTGKNLYGPKVGVGAGLLLAVAPLHVLLSHYATVDAPVTFFVALSFLFSSLILRKNRTKWYLLAGACAGLAAGIKYNGGIVIIPLITATILSEQRTKKILALAGALLSAGIFFVATTPYLLGEFTSFWGDIKIQSHYLINTGHGPIFVNTSPGFLYQLLYNLYQVGGIWFWLLSMLGIICCLKQHKKPDILLFSWIIPYFILISIPTVKFARFLLPLFPFLVLAAARILAISSFSRSKAFSIKWLFSLGAIWLLLISLGYLWTLAGPDPRQEANQWLREYLPVNSRVGLIKTETGLGFLDDPPLHEPGFKAKLIRYPRLLPALNDRPDYLIVSDFDYRQILRLGEHYDIKRKQQWLEFLTGKTGYRLIKTFQRPPSLGPLVFGGSFPPHDMKYNWPLIQVFSQDL